MLTSPAKVSDRKPASLLERAVAPVDVASLACFRIAFGAVMAWEVVRYFQKGWISTYYIAPQFHFTYYGFGWVKPWPGPWMYVHFAVLGLASLGIAAGLWYRLSAVVFFLGFTYVFLLEQTNYLNHFYLITLLGFVMIFLPANRALSLDAWLRPALRSDYVPAWTLWILRIQIGLPYFFGGVASSTETGCAESRSEAGWPTGRTSRSSAASSLSSGWGSPSPTAA